ncbi:hypothetical protein ACFQ36_13555 [Arthrobacter sp. GCM10027362]|uniref:hypothetical protein n=1 Tax=Arthrobacter sp. GCM10027362 TaxID=3273379 RepID=UPI00362AA9EF
MLALTAAAMVLAIVGLSAAEHWIYPAKDQDIHAVLAELDRREGGRLAPVRDVTAAACGNGRCRQAVSTGGDGLFVRFATRELAAQSAAREAEVPGREAYRSEWVVVSYPAGTPARDIALFREIFPESEKSSPGA